MCIINSKFTCGREALHRLQWLVFCIYLSCSVCLLSAVISVNKRFVIIVLFLWQQIICCTVTKITRHTHSTGLYILNHVPNSFLQFTILLLQPQHLRNRSVQRSTSRSEIFHSTAPCAKQHAPVSRFLTLINTSSIQPVPATNRWLWYFNMCVVLCSETRLGDASFIVASLWVCNGALLAASFIAFARQIYVSVECT